MTSTGGGRRKGQVAIGMARKTVEESEQTCIKLMEAGIRMFAEYGYAYSALDDIAKCAGLSLGAGYGHFKEGVDKIN
ncbi:TetR family transcriptional regulator [Pseudomonas helleri]|uniref:TetR family transcriptional regulator n=1 Tax=Pseudomonas helleri TaxID=1608996 RepID=A0A6L5HVF2_9PSED|nr:TetR family transcriptional regulator [Pseudomonas helleri]MQU06917.1 TetR family transcriptional regulator [Pseudomonas helleri]